MGRLFVGRLCATLALCVGVAQADGSDVYDDSGSFEAGDTPAEFEPVYPPQAFDRSQALDPTHPLDPPQALEGPAAYAPDALARFEVGTALEIAEEATVDRVLLVKSQRRLILLSGNLPVREYSIALGGAPEGHKRQQGDQRTPEGRYLIDWRNADSDYYRALHISYPNDEDRRRAEERGVDPGGSIMIHGLPNGLEMIGASHRVADWTDGCVAVTNEEMDEIWERVQDGVPIDIRP